MNTTDYVDYFKNLAINHPLIDHNDTVGNRSFVISIEEALDDFRTGFKEKGFYMRLIMYQYGIEDNQAADPRKVPMAGFIISRYHKKGDYDDYIEALTQCEIVVDDIIERMSGDSASGNPLFYRSMETLNGINVNPSPFSGDINYSGWLCTLKFENKFRNCLEQNIPGWKDL